MGGCEKGNRKEKGMKRILCWKERQKRKKMWICAKEAKTWKIKVLKEIKKNTLKEKEEREK